MRCKLIKFNEGCAGAVDVSVDKIGAISDGNMAEKAEDIATYPLARPGKDGILPFEGINPAWQAAFANLKALVLDVEFPKKKGITEAEWNGILAKFDAFKAWKGAKAGAAVESLGADAANAILKADRKADLLALVEADLAKTEESNAIDEVDKLMHLYRDFFSFLNNYVVFADFYAPDKKAMFQAGRLYIDQRSTDLCIKVDGPSAEISSLSGMYILYCNCVNEKTGKTMNIAAVLTDGDVDGLRAGKNAVFYDRAGDDWSAKVTAIVENPISIRQAFWAPYKKVGRMINDKIDKSAAEKNEKSMAGLTSATDSATSAKLDGTGKDSAKAITSSFDIAKFAGIFAAIGMAVGFIGQFIVAVVKGIAAIKFWVLILIILGIMLLISGPSMFIAWRKLRKRDLGPVLNANGWAINSAAYVNIKFGATLTDLAKYPKLQAVDPEARKKRNRRRFFIWLIVILLAAGAALFFTDNLKCIGLPFHKEQPAVEQVECPDCAQEAAEAAEAEAAPEAEAASE